MALIKCPECGKEISDKSMTCTHCGFPLNEFFSEKGSKSGWCRIDGIEYDLTDLKDYVLSKQRRAEVSLFDKSQELIKMIPDFSILAAANLMLEIEKNGEVPTSFNSRQYTIELKQDDDLVHCPRCDSTQIVTGQRGYSLMWGFLGSNKTMNRCASCGYKWEPRKW